MLSSRLIILLTTLALALLPRPVLAWGFYAHQRINYYAVFLLPPPLSQFYKMHQDYVTIHAVDADKRRYMLASEAPRHYIDIDHYGLYPYDSLPRSWNAAMARYGADSLDANGIVPWWILSMLNRLTTAFREKNIPKILKLSADIGHYLGDAHVPLHTSSNHNGQKTGQEGIHGFWESRIPELLAEKEWNFFERSARYLSAPEDFIWARILESARAADTVLRMETETSAAFSSDRKYAYEDRNGKLVRQNASDFARAYNKALQGMVERRMRSSIFAVACFWYTAWVDAGQPDLEWPESSLALTDPNESKLLETAWKQGVAYGRKEEED